MGSGGISNSAEHLLRYFAEQGHRRTIAPLKMWHYRWITGIPAGTSFIPDEECFSTKTLFAEWEVSFLKLLIKSSSLPARMPAIHSVVLLFMRWVAAEFQILPSICCVISLSKGTVNAYAIEDAALSMDHRHPCRCFLSQAKNVFPPKPFWLNGKFHF